MTWAPEKIERLKVMAAAGAVVRQIADDLGMSSGAVESCARRLKVKIQSKSPEQKAIFAERAKERARESSRRRLARRKAARHEATVAARKAAMLSAPARTGVTTPAPYAVQGLSLPQKRKLYASTPSLSKTEMRAFLTQAVLNTAAQVTP
jgi:hypothetical protein